MASPPPISPPQLLELLDASHRHLPEDRPHAWCRQRTDACDRWKLLALGVIPFAPLESPTTSPLPRSSSESNPPNHLVTRYLLRRVNVPIDGRRAARDDHWPAHNGRQNAPRPSLHRRRSIDADHHRCTIFQHDLRRGFLSTGGIDASRRSRPLQPSLQRFHESSTILAGDRCTRHYKRSRFTACCAIG